MSKETARVVLAYPYTPKDGKPRKAGETVALPPQEAHNLVAKGRARVADAGKPANTKPADNKPQNKEK